MFVAGLFEAHGRMVHAICRMVLRDREEAEDATQQTFLLAHRSLLGGGGPEQPEAWLATIARNECYRRLGRRAPETVPLLEGDGGGGDPSGVADQRAEIEALCEALGELPPAQRQALVLREFYGLSYREVAAALGVSGPAVESLLFKSRRRLQDRLRRLRAASSALMLPLAVRDALAAAIPGFSGAASGAGAGAGGAVLAKVGSAPLAAKVAAVVVVAGAGTGATVAELREGLPATPARAAVDERAAVERPEPVAVTPRRVARGAPVPAADDDDVDESGDETADDEERDDRGDRVERDDETEDEEERDGAVGRADDDSDDDSDDDDRSGPDERARSGSSGERAEVEVEDEPDEAFEELEDETHD